MEQEVDILGVGDHSAIITYAKSQITLPIDITKFKAKIDAEIRRVADAEIYKLAGINKVTGTHYQHLCGREEEA